MTRQVKPVRPAAKMFGVEFSEDQWHAANIRPPLWNLNPPQREEYDHDAAYAVALREYADRVIEYGKEKEK